MDRQAGVRPAPPTLSRPTGDDGLPPSRLQLPPGDWPTLIDGLCARFPAIPREQWRDRFARGRVQDRDGEPLAAVHPYRVGMELRYFRAVPDEIGRAHVCTTVTNAHLVCRILLEKKKTT